MSNDFDVTTGTLAREAGTSTVTVLRYAAAGLLQYRRASDGSRLFKRGQAHVVREQLAQSLSMRGKHRR